MPTKVFSEWWYVNCLFFVHAHDVKIILKLFFSYHQMHFLYISFSVPSSTKFIVFYRKFYISNNSIVLKSKIWLLQKNKRTPSWFIIFLIECMCVFNYVFLGLLGCEKYRSFPFSYNMQLILWLLSFIATFIKMIKIVNKMCNDLFGISHILLLI